MRSPVDADPKNELEVAGKAGQPIPLPIAPGPATGYVWHLDLPEGVKRIEDAPPPPHEGPLRPGEAYGGPLQVTAPPGDHLIVARLARPWQPDAPARIVRIHVHVT